MRKSVKMFFMLFILFIFNENVYAIEPPSIDFVELSGDEIITMHIGDEITLEALAEPVGFDYAYFLWTTDNDDIITLTGDDGTTKCEPPISTATIKAIGIGTVVVTVYADLWAEPSPDEWIEHDSITINVVSGYSNGDSNGDSEIDVKDVVALRRFLVSGYTETIFADVADVNKDGNVDVKDVVILRRFIAGGYGVEF